MVDPFEYPPLVEWENCVTTEELKSTLEGFKDIHSRVPKWRYFKRRDLEVSMGTLIGLLLFLKTKQQ